MAAKTDVFTSHAGEQLVAIIGDEDTVTGFLLAGTGQVDAAGTEREQRNFFIVDDRTPQSELERAFARLTSRTDVSILLITQHVASEVRHLLDAYSAPLPTILEIPSKSKPYNSSEDSMMQRIRQLQGL